jgi:hypothetical protein
VDAPRPSPFAEWCERLQWRLQAEQNFGFPREVAARLAFWRWWARCRGEHRERREKPEP